MNLVASFTLINRWDNCRYQVKRMYITRDLERAPDTKEQSFGNETHDAFRQRIKHKIPFPEKIRHFEKWASPLDQYKVEPELRISIASNGELTSQYEGSWLFGKLDCPIVNDTETVAILNDWKTGKSIREEPLELNIQGFLLKAKYPTLQKIVGHYVWLTYDKMGVPHDCSDYARTWSIVNTHMSNIKDAIRDDDFPKNPGPLCAWCPVRDCEHNRARR
jgi:hypothetical protein